jgi:hypothetical protein
MAFPMKPHVAREFDKGSIKAREDRSTLVATHGPNSPLWGAVPAVGDSGKKLVTAGDELTAGAKLVKSLESQLDTARKGLVVLTGAWDQAFELFATNVETHAVQAADISSLGLVTLDPATYKLAAPLSIDVAFDVKKSAIRIHVHRAPGAHKCIVEISAEPISPGSFKQAKGNGARRTLTGYPPGMYWVRAATVNADDQSEWTGPVAVIVK